MLYHLLYPLHQVFSAFNVFRYLTFRTAYAVLTALLISFLLGSWLIRLLKRYQIGERIRELGPKSHQSKAGTPTMGGILILIALTLPTLLWADLTNPYIWLLLYTAFGFGVIGFADDYLKISGRRREGLRVREKFLAQSMVALGVALFLYFYPDDPILATKLSVPFFKNFTPDLGPGYVLFVVLVIVATSNAVNLTDGLDGLATGPIIIAISAYTVIVYLAGHVKFAEYLNIFYIKSAGEVTVFCGAVLGASLGFLWYNAYPAQVFMGNVGSLSLGGVLGTIAVISKHEALLFLVGGIFVIEVISVILQVVFFKITSGKRLFLMAPLHHHFEEKGWEEPKVIVRFWIIAIILALLSLSTLKLR